MRGRERKPKREELCDEIEFRTDQADSASNRCPSHSGGASGDAATRTAVQNDRPRGVVVNLASWTDADKASLEPHEPEATDLVVDLETDTRH